MFKLRTRTILLIGLIEILVVGGVIWYVWGRPQGRADRFSRLGKTAEHHGWKGTAEWLDKAAGDIRSGQATDLKSLLKKSEERLVAGKTKEAEELVLQALQGSKSQSVKESKSQNEDDLKRQVNVLQQIARNDKSTDMKALASYLAVRKKLTLAEKHYSKKTGAALHEARYAARREAADSAATAVTRFPKSYWASRALLFAATQHALIGEQKLAKLEFQKLVKEYPKTPAATEARKHLTTS